MEAGIAVGVGAVYNGDAALPQLLQAATGGGVGTHHLILRHERRARDPHAVAECARQAERVRTIPSPIVRTRCEEVGLCDAELQLAEGADGAEVDGRGGDSSPAALMWPGVCHGAPSRPRPRSPASADAQCSSCRRKPSFGRASGRLALMASIAPGTL